MQNLKLYSKFFSLFKLKLWSYYTRENLCTGPMYDLDLLAIGNLNQSASASNQKQTAPVTTTTTNTSSTNDDLWYPVPIQSAVDYYEQLDPLLPTQYEQLLKQLMRMQNQQQPSTPSGAQLPQVLLNGENEPLGWKQVWDGYYELAENKLSNEIETSGGETRWILLHYFYPLFLLRDYYNITSGKMLQKKSTRNYGFLYYY